VIAWYAWTPGRRLHALIHTWTASSLLITVDYAGTLDKAEDYASRLYKYGENHVAVSVEPQCIVDV